MDVTSRTHRVGTRLAHGAAIALVAASGLLLAGCGDPDGGATPTPGSTATPTLPPETPGAPLPPGTPVPGEPGQPDEPGAGEPEPTVTSTERLDPDDQQTIPPQR
ncbi:hypothetical protein [Frigoribacterium salinisoli]